MEKFKEETTFEDRVLKSKKLLLKFSDRIPVIVKPGNKITPDIDKYKYLVPSELTIGEFVNIIRKRIKLDSKKAMFVFVGGVLPPTASTLYSVYQEHRDEDGFLYITYSLENTFG
jgi:GABA(A) receptor-associated protein